MLENSKKFKEFKIICYLCMSDIYKLFPELKPQVCDCSRLIGAIMPTQQQLDRIKQRIEEKDREWELVLQKISETGFHIMAQLSIKKEFILHPGLASNLLGDELLKYEHDRAIAVFDGQIYYDQSEDCTDITGAVKNIARSLFEVLRCDTKLLFDGVEYSFTF